MASTVPIWELIRGNTAAEPGRVGSQAVPAAPSSASRRKFFPALDGIRFFAVFVVLLKHTGAGASSSSAALRVVGRFAKYGSGVPLFFVVSGFLITSILLDTQGTANRYRNFVARRSLRIFPLYYLYVFAAIAFTGWATISSMRDPWVFLLYLQNVLIGRAESTNSVLPMFHLWTLGVQEQFYLLWPLLVWRCRSVQSLRRLCWIVFGVSVASRVYLVSIGQFQMAELLMPCRAGEMSLGGLFALEMYEQTWIMRVWPKLLLPLGGALLWSLSFYEAETPWGILLRQELIVMFSVALLAAGLTAGSLGARLLSFPLLAKVGRKYSYGLFIFHPMLLQFCERKLHLGHGTMDGVTRVLVTVAGGLLLSAISYEAIERPCLTFKRYFEDRRVAPRVSAGEMVASR